MEKVINDLDEEERTYAHSVNLFNGFYGYSNAGLGRWRALEIPEKYLLFSQINLLNV